MSHEEKVLFLFSQTCTILAGQSAAKATSETSATMKAIAQRVAPGIAATRSFDEIYASLEAKLNEKLSAQN
ncbi:hypothetical protein [Dickeya dadantii]|uniref:hypothetical protein n=1 Tax=Dickeya dadantii TaxID=204038 RepID=UPI001C0E6B3F|nr:hypothetical protein [Dickeya dadantii]QWT42583.1 hypothetical protein KNV89_08980 [Dickeya dadantii]